MISVAFLPHTGYQQVEQLIKNIMKSINGQYFVQHYRIYKLHTANSAQQRHTKVTLSRSFWKGMAGKCSITPPPPPPHILQTSPPDFDLFPKMKELLRGVRYDSLDELECAVNAEVRRINFSCLATGQEALPSTWSSVTRSRGDYFEGL